MSWNFENLPPRYVDASTQMFGPGAGGFDGLGEGRYVDGGPGDYIDAFTQTPDYFGRGGYGMIDGERFDSDLGAGPF